MNTIGDIMTQVLVRNNQTTTDAFITDAMLRSWAKSAHTWASAFRKWPMTEGRVSTTYAGVEEISFEGYKADSIRFLKIGSSLYQKIGFRDYQQMKDDTPDSSDKVFTDFGRTILINTLSGGSGTLTAYGQYQPVLDTTDLQAKTIFSDYDEEGNEAIFLKMTSYLKNREHLPDEEQTFDEKATAKLTEVSERIAEEQHGYHNQNGDGMFKRMDVINGGFEDDLFNRDQF